MAEIKILALVGSLRAASINGKIAELAVAVAPDDVTVTIFEGLADLPFYNEDIDDSMTPGAPSLAPVAALRAAGVPAVVSGAGPSVLAFLTEDPTQDDLKRLDSIAGETGIEWHISPLVVERQGASVTPDVPSAR